MPNTLGVYNPIFYANEALIQLEKALGMASRVHSGFDAERRGFQKGETINIRRPSVLTTNDAPATAEDLTTETVTITLDKWREVKFKLSDKELTFTQQRIIDDHIRPAAFSLADDIDQKLVALYKDIPWFLDVTGALIVDSLTDIRKVMFDNSVPLQDINSMHVMLDGQGESDLLKLAAFSQQQGAGDQGVNTQLRGSLGMKFGMEIFANQNTPTHTKGTGSVTAVLTNGTPAKGATTVSLDAVSLSGTVVPGDSFVIAGNSQRYAITNTVTAATNELVGVTFTPGLAVAPGDGAAVTLKLSTGVRDIAFHRNAFALVIAPLPEMGNELGAKVATVTDPITGLSIRSRIYYVGNSSEVHVALDVLYGVKTLDPNLAALIYDDGVDT